MRHPMEQKLKAWFVPPSSGLHLDVADGLRGLAILLVVCGHGFFFNPNSSEFLVFAGKVISTGWIGVRLFFVLSGFLISLPFFCKREKDSRFWYVRGYASRRLLKIFPPFYLTVAFLILFYFLRYHDAEYVKLGLAWASGVAHFVFLPKYFNSSFWSLWVELGFYAVLPFLFFLVRGRSPRVAGVILFAILIGVPFITRGVTWRDAADPGVTFLVASRFPSALDNFAWGVLFAAFYASMSKSPERWRFLGRIGYAGGALMALSCVLFAVTPTLVAAGRISAYTEGELQHVLPGLSAFLLLFFGFDPSCWAARLFSSPLMRFVGIVSYEWFLLHQPAQLQFREWMGPCDGHFVKYLFVVSVPTIASLIAAILLYHNFSLPILRWGRGRVKESEPRVSSACPVKNERPVL